MILGIFLAIAAAICWRIGFAPIGFLLLPLGLTRLAAGNADPTIPVVASYLLFLFVLSSLLWAEKSWFAASCIALLAISLISMAGCARMLNNWGH